MELNKSTIDGITLITETGLDSLCLPQRDTVGGYLNGVSDQASLKNLRSLVKQRERDFKEKRMDFLGPKLGHFHCKIALLKDIFPTLMPGGKDNTLDPGSLARFIDVLGRSQVDSNVTDYGACHRLVQTVLDDYILEAGAKIAGDELKDLGAWI